MLLVISNDTPSENGVVESCIRIRSVRQSQLFEAMNTQLPCRGVQAVFLALESSKVRSQCWAVSLSVLAKGECSTAGRFH